MIRKYIKKGRREITDDITFWTFERKGAENATDTLIKALLGIGTPWIYGLVKWFELDREENEVKGWRKFLP